MKILILGAGKMGSFFIDLLSFDHEVAVFEPTNKHYKDFVRIMHNPVFKDKKHCILEPKLFEIANS